MIRMIKRVGDFKKMEIRQITFRKDKKTIEN